MDSDILRAFDRAGIDAFRFHSNGIQGIASRVVSTNYGPSFTVRHTYYDGNDEKTDCEYAKKLYAIKNPGDHDFFPHFSVQSFITDSQCHWSIVVDTKDLLLFIEKNKNKSIVGNHFNRHGGTRFYSVDCEILAESGVVVHKL